jgi:prefoldin subunit 5
MAKDLEDARAARARLEARIVELEGDLARLGKSNDQLREVNEALRSANEAQVGDSQLINSALSAEVEALRASHAASQTEVRAILDALAPLVAADTATEEA